MEYKNYFWDFDGTLYNSYPGMVRAFVETLKTKEIELDSKEVFFFLFFFFFCFVYK